MPTPNEFSRVTFSGSPRQEYGQVNPSDTYPAAGTDQVPTEGEPKQWQASSDKASTPEAMASETSESQNAFAELQTFLMNNLETPGSRVCHDQTKPYRPSHGAEGE
jgi:hypothetical protein